MLNITITLNNKKFHLACNDGEEQELYNLAAKLDRKITEIKQSNPQAPFELLLVMASLSLQEQIEELTNRLSKVDNGQLLNEEEQFAETLSTIAGYLENLAQKIGK